MHKKLKEGGIQRLARATWEDYFRSRIHPKAKTSWLTALITFVTGIVIVFGIIADTVRAASQYSAGTPAVSFIAVGLILAAVAFWLKGEFAKGADRDRFVESSLESWEAAKGAKPLPDFESLRKYLGQGE